MKTHEIQKAMDILRQEVPYHDVIVRAGEGEGCASSKSILKAVNAVLEILEKEVCQEQTPQCCAMCGAPMYREFLEFFGMKPVLSEELGEVFCSERCRSEFTWKRKRPV